jgi:choline dehydrogenase-like flavoprotein
MRELQVSIPEDGASGQAYGVYYPTHSQDPTTATRSDARTAYYNPVANRPNLHLLTGQQVTRLITQSSSAGARVTAVEVGLHIACLAARY